MDRDAQQWRVEDFNWGSSQSGAYLDTRKAALSAAARTWPGLQEFVYKIYFLAANSNSSKSNNLS